MDALHKTTTPSSHHEEEIIDLREYWRVMNSRKWALLGFSSIVTLLAVLIVFNITPIYRATSTLLIESQQTNVVSIQEVYGLDGSSEYLLTQFEILKSRKLAKKVILKYKLLDNPDYNSALESSSESSFFETLNPTLWLTSNFPDLFTHAANSPPPDGAILENAIDAFIGNLTISPVRKTQLVNISFESSDPVLAARIANAVADTYIEDNLAAKLELTVKATSWLNDQLKDQRVDLTKAETALQNYREKEQIIGENGGLGIAEREIDLVSTKLVDARRERLELENIYQQIRKLGRKNASRLQLIPSILSHPLVQNLKDVVASIEIRRSEIANRYGSKHPKMKAINSERSRAYNNLNQQIISIARGIENKYKVAVAAEKSLERSLTSTKTDMQILSSKEYKLKELQQNVDTKRELYDQFHKRFSETNATGDLKTANARITDPASIPVNPVRPKKKQIIALTFVCSLFFAIIVAFLLKALDNCLRTSLDVESKLNEAMLGLLPLLQANKAEKNQSYNHYNDAPHSGYSEALRTIRTSIMLSSIDKPYKILSVTSTVPGEGKTSASLGLAYCMAQVGSVLLIDADMRRPSIHKALQLTTHKNGLSNLIAQTHNMEECIVSYEEGGFDVLPCGMIPPNPSELLSSSRFNDLLLGLAQVYDKIIIDTAPCQAVSDALILAPMIDTYLYIVKADSTNAQHAKNGLKRIRQAGGNLSGVILNQVDVKKAKKYYGEDYSGYYDRYGYSGIN